MKIVLFGRGGQVGGELMPRLPACGELVAYDVADASFERPDDVAALARAAQADVIVNAAAYTAVDRAETEAEKARIVNAETVAALAAEARRRGAMLVHYSTDYVFDGAKAGPYVEDDPPAPLSVYGRTKLEGEQAIARSGCRHWILRTSWVYAARGHNFVRTMLKLGRERDELRVVDDQVGSPTPAALIADVTAEFVRRLGAGRSPDDGIYHLTPRGETSWHGFTRRILAEARAQGAALRCPPDRVAAIATADYPLPAPRPLNSRLCTAKLEATLGERLPAWEDGVAAVVAAIMAEDHPRPETT
ncbi:dTDP-4-dehydrorhamnose reductase [bacterium]|nr:dTDP-4-dehydrorhamnose reductase [bacterium]